MLRKTLPFTLLIVFAGAQAAPLFRPQVAAPPTPKAGQKTGKLVGSFDKAEMEAMVAELSLYIPQNPKLQYPIDCDFVETKQVNAYATTKEIPGNPKRQAVMRVLTGILKFIDDACASRLVVGLDPDDASKKIALKPGDERRLLRAVIAHELGHLSKGHVIQGDPKGRDMAVIYTRETEQEADMVGAAALQRAGYSRSDAEHMLMMTEAADGGSVADNLMGNHADGKRRALSVASDPRVLRALVEYDLGLAFGEVRNYSQATVAFDRAAQREPKLKEAYINAAQSAISEYYYKLGGGLRAKWFRPDFGPLLGSPISSRDTTFIDADRRRYADAEKRAALALQKAPDNGKTLEVVGLVGVLHPDGDAGRIANGITNLNKALAMAMDPADRLRIANNLAVGYQRAGDVAKGTDLLVATFKMTSAYNSAGAANLGFAPLPKSMSKDAGIAANAMYKYLVTTPKDSPGYQKVADNYKALSALGVTVKELPAKGAALNLTQVYSITDGGQEVALFDQFAVVEQKLGKGTVELGILASGEDRVQMGKAVGIFEAKFRNGQVAAIFQTRSGEQTVARITSYSPGAYLELRPVDVGAGETFRVTNGMKEAELYNRVPQDSGASVKLFRVGQLEEWIYFPGLNFGVQIKNGVVVGITASPAE